jgi:hypothetical protein
MDEEKSKNYIYVEFEDEHSAIFNIRFENVVPGQMLAVAAYLDFEGKNQLALQKAAQMQAEMQNKIAVPKPKVSGTL